MFKVTNLRNANLILIFTTLAYFPSAGIAKESNDEQFVDVASRIFAEAEAKNYVEQFLNQNSPINGVENFGSSAIFALQLFLAADAYGRAQNDQQRFAAVRGGIAAYVAYSYAATPAVGLAVTAVALATQIIEANVASSYNEAMLKILKDIQETQLRINDLNARLGQAEALRFLTHLNSLGRIGREIATLNLEMQLDCKKQLADFDELSYCLTKLVRSLVLREELISTFDLLLAMPDSMLAIIASKFLLKPESTSSQATPAQGDVDEADPAKAARKGIESFKLVASKQLAELKIAYHGFVKDYQRLVVTRIFDEALSEVQRLKAIDDVRHRCLLDRTRLTKAATTLLLQWEVLNQERHMEGSEFLTKMERLNIRKSSLVTNYQQRTISCATIMVDTELQQLMSIVTSRE